MIVLYVIIGLIASYIIFRIFILPHILYNVMLVRTNKKKWARNRKSKDQEISMMYEKGNKWLLDNLDCLIEVSIVSDGLKLVGNYYDFHKNKAVLIYPGRQETLDYSAYFAEPYKKAGYNILLVDPRAHGLSDGKENYAGNREYMDIEKWLLLLKEQYSNNELAVHGICVGGATALITACECKNIHIDKMILDSPYLTYKSMFSRHFKNTPFKDLGLSKLVVRIINKKSNKNTDDYAPIKLVKKYVNDLLILFSNKDEYVFKEEVEKLYNESLSKNKVLIILENGSHSHLRINNQQKYDKEIVKYLIS